MMPLVRVEKLSKTFYGSGFLRQHPVQALQELSFEIQQGEIFGLVGESGSGKTTLARTMLFLIPPSEGKIYFKDRCLNDLPPRSWRRMRSKMQIIFQDPQGSLNPRMSIQQSLEEGLVNLGIPRKKRQERIRKALDEVGIPQAQAGWFPHEFSGGQKQRIVIARALAMRPEFLVLDEPVSNLDVSIQAGIINLLLDLKKEFNFTYLFISHNLDLIGYLSDRVGVLKEGRLIETGLTEELLTKPQHPYTQELVENPLSFIESKNFKGR